MNRSILVLAGAVMLNWPGFAPAHGPTRVDWNKKRIAFEMSGKDWKSIFLWLADQAQMPYASDHRVPEGSLVFVTPRNLKTGEPMKYTLNEIFDIVNERLRKLHKFTIIRGDTALIMVPTNKEIAGKLIPLISLDELKDRARTEIVELRVRYNPLVETEENRLAIKNKLGLFGRVTTYNDVLMMRGDVASLRSVIAELTPPKKATPPPAVPPPLPAARCESAPRCRVGLLRRLLRR